MNEHIYATPFLVLKGLVFTFGIEIMGFGSAEVCFVS